MSPFALCELRGDCVVDLGVRPFAVLHYVLAGRATVSIGRNLRVDVSAGTMLLAPAFLTHAFHVTGATGEGEPLAPLRLEGLQNIVLGHTKSGEPLWAICGRLEIVFRGVGGALSLLRAPIVEHLSQDDRVRLALDQFIHELGHPSVGSHAVAESLLEQCVIRLFRRRYLARDPSLRWIDGAANERLWPALEAMLDLPEAAHDVDSLAARCGLSRSVFAEHFGRAYQSGPIEILRTIRMHRAADLLTRSDLPVKRVAELTGYRSRTYFSRAFKAEFGLPPSKFKRLAEE